MLFDYRQFSILCLYHYHDIKKAEEYFNKMKKIATNLEEWRSIASASDWFCDYFRDNKNQTDYDRYNKIHLKYKEKAIKSRGKTYSYALRNTDSY